MKLKEIISIIVLVIFFNWFINELLNRYEPMINPASIKWIVGFYTGAILMKLEEEIRNKE